MPIFLDVHLGGELPRKQLSDFLRAARSVTRDSFGVLPLELYCGEDGRLFCVVAAPDEASARAHHAALGIMCQRMRRVLTARPCIDELGGGATSAVRRMIAAERTWPLRVAS